MSLVFTVHHSGVIISHLIVPSLNAGLQFFDKFMISFFAAAVDLKVIGTHVVFTHLTSMHWNFICYWSFTGNLICDSLLKRFYFPSKKMHNQLIEVLQVLNKVLWIIYNFVLLLFFKGMKNLECIFYVWVQLFITIENLSSITNHRLSRVSHQRSMCLMQLFSSPFWWIWLLFELLWYSFSIRIFCVQHCNLNFCLEQQRKLWTWVTRPLAVQLHFN